MPYNYREMNLETLTIEIAALEHADPESYKELISELKQERDKLLIEMGIKPAPTRRIKDPQYKYRPKRKDIR